MMTKKTNNESKHITGKGTFFFGNCQRIVSKGHIAPVVENNLVSLFDSCSILSIIIYSSWGASVSYPKQCISSLKSFFMLLLKDFILSIVFCMSLVFLNIFSLYTYRVFLNETNFYVLKVLAISQLLLKYSFENEGIKNSVISCYLLFKDILVLIGFSQ